MLNGKTAVITGASRGIGRAITLNMARNGASVAIIYLDNKTSAGEVVRQAKSFGVKAEAYRCNVADWNESKDVCQKIIADFGSVDILVNNAGIIRDNLVLRMSEADFDDVMDTSLKGAFNFIKHLSLSIIKSTSGRIINVSSISGIAGNAGQANYATAKAGMIGLTKSIAKEFAGRNVTCNAIAPGLIETDMTASMLQTSREHLYSAIPLKRAGTADEVANLAVFLASDLASYITGEIIRVDGGLCI